MVIGERIIAFAREIDAKFALSATSARVVVMGTLSLSYPIPNPNHILSLPVSSTTTTLLIETDLPMH